MSALMTRLVLAFVVAALWAGCTSGPSDDSAQYLQELEARRNNRQQFMREDPESPIPADKKSALLPLPYFAPDPAFSVPAFLKLSEERPTFEMPTSTGTPRRMQLVGSLEFTLQGQKMTLGAFVPDGTQQITSLFVPFADLTTGSDTYSAGRYLDIEPTSTGVYLIDFNDAYNPSCAYNPTYECPFPPPSNRLKVAVKAGEKAPAVHAS